MYLRQSNKWKEFLLAEAIEDIGLPPTIAHYLRQQNEAFGPIENKHLTWLGQLVKRARTDLLLPRADLEEIKRHLRRAVITTLEKRDGLNPEAFGELYAEAVAPLIEYRQGVQETSPNIAHIKKFKKKFMKNLRRLEIIPPFIKGFDSYVDNRMRKGVEEAFMKSVKPIMLLLAEDPYTYQDIRWIKLPEGGEAGRSLRTAGEKAQDMLDNPPKDPDKVIHEFSNGYYWYDIGSHQCDIEAKEMGHCGSADDGTLYSLRVGDKRSVKRMILLAFDGSIVYQIKANANAAPKEHLWTYVDWFLENMDVDKIVEKGSHSKDAEGFDKMLEYLQEKHPDIDQTPGWTVEATDLLNQWEGSIERDSQTFLELDWPGGTDNVQEVGVVLRHEVFWPVKDIIVDEDTAALRWEITRYAQNIANDTLYPNPNLKRNAATIFPRGAPDSRTAMIRLELVYAAIFEPDDINDEETVKTELEYLERFLEDLINISGWLTSPTAAYEDDEFDYNSFYEEVQEKLEALGVYRDIAAEQDAETERERAADRGQMELPLQEQRIIQRWNKIIK